MADAWDIIYRCNVTWSLLGQNCISSFFFRNKPTATYASVPAEMADLHNQIAAFLLNPMRGVMSQQVQQIASVVVNLNGDSFYEDVKSYTGIFGGVASNSLPSYCAQVVSWRTAYRGRRVHGRTYIPGVPLSSANGNDLTSAAQTALHNFADTVLSNFGETERYSYPFLVVYSRKNGVTLHAGPPPYLSYDPLAGVPVTRYVTDIPIYTQRHRLEGRGI